MDTVSGQYNLDSRDVVATVKHGLWGVGSAPTERGSNKMNMDCATTNLGNTVAFARAGILRYGRGCQLNVF